MDIAHFEDRLKLLVKAGEQSIANHNALLGRIEEAKDNLAAFVKSKEQAIPEDCQECERVDAEADAQSH
jgi:hypothetical protein